MNWTVILDSVAEPLLALAGLLIAEGIRQGVMILKTRTNIDVTKQAQDTLKSAVMTGLRSLLLKENSDSVPDSRLIEAAVKHVLGSGAPDSVKKLGVSIEGIRTLAESAIPAARRSVLDEQMR